MTARAYLATDIQGLRVLHRDGVLPSDMFEPFFADSEDEQDEFDAMCHAADYGGAHFEDVVVVAVDIELGAPAVDVPLEAVASLHTGPELSWYAVQELADLVD